MDFDTVFTMNALWIYLSILSDIDCLMMTRKSALHTVNALSEAQCGFRTGQGMVDMIFSLKQIQEKCIKQNRPLYTVFVDFTKAFDTVHRETLWKILWKIGYPDLFVHLIASLHKDMKASVSLNGELSKPFDVQNGVKQGCVLAPSLFLSKALNCAFAGCDKGVIIQSKSGATYSTQISLQPEPTPSWSESTCSLMTLLSLPTRMKACRKSSLILPPQQRPLGCR